MSLFIYMYMFMLEFFILLIMVLISVAFLTLMERKFLGYIQMRKGPNKLGVMGIVQPFSDAIKLLSKEYLFMLKSNYIIFILSPMFMFILIIIMWVIYPFFSNYFLMSLSLLFLMCCFSVSVYGMLLSGWSSNSMYSMLGAIRSLAQAISYEVSLSLIMIMPFIMLNSFDLMKLFIFQSYISLMVLLWPLSLLFFISMLAELNRTPFDFSEGESELVSGFNVEYSSVGFTLIFLAEYASIMFLSMLFVMFYLGSDPESLIFYLKIFLLSLLIIWVRGTLPRFRYDLLMYLCWLMILPFSLNFMIVVIVMKVYIFSFSY